VLIFDFWMLDVGGMRVLLMFAAASMPYAPLYYAIRSFP
jgi:hypothetical protein